ncbi:MAG: hypothetical protein ACI4V7_12740 [Succinivibrionaceae bacterium]
MIDIVFYGYTNLRDSQGNLSRFFNSSYQIEKNGWRGAEKYDMIRIDLKYLGLVENYHVYNLRMDKKQFETENVFQDYFRNNTLIVFSDDDYRGSLSLPWRDRVSWIRELVPAIMEENVNVENGIKKPNQNGEYVREISYFLSSGFVNEWTMTKTDDKIAVILATNNNVLYNTVDNFCYKKDAQLTTWNDETIKNSVLRIINRSKSALLAEQKKVLKAKKEIKSIVINTLNIEDYFEEFDFLKIEKHPSDNQIYWKFTFKTIYDDSEKLIYVYYDTNTKLYSFSCRLPGRKSDIFYMYFEQSNIDKLFSAVKGLIYAFRYGSGTQKSITEYNKAQKNAQK